MLLGFVMSHELGHLLMAKTSPSSRIARRYPEARAEDLMEGRPECGRSTRRAISRGVSAIVKALAPIPDDTVIDGEVVALD
jgi:hypothetical protein